VLHQLKLALDARLDELLKELLLPTFNYDFQSFLNLNTWPSILLCQRTIFRAPTKLRGCRASFLRGSIANDPDDLIFDLILAEREAFGHYLFLKRDHLAGLVIP
jgi:hypothetical protein